MKKEKLSVLCMIASIVALLGFVIENVWLYFRYSEINNRNMILPLLLGYGLAIVILYFLFGTPKHPKFIVWAIETRSRLLNTAFYFLVSGICVMVGEYSMGMFVEKVMGFKWWSYESLPLHITQYTSIPTTVAFALIIVLFMSLAFYPLHQTFSKIKSKWFHFFSYLVMILMIADFIHSAIYMYQNQTTFQLWSIRF